MVLNFKSQKSVEFIFNYLSNSEKFVSVHPVIFRMEALDDQRLKVYETLKFGFLPITFTYPASIESDAVKKTITMKAVVMKVTKIEMQYRLSVENGYTLIEETIHIKSWLPVAFLMRKIFNKQHQLLFENIERLKENT